MNGFSSSWVLWAAILFPLCAQAQEAAAPPDSEVVAAQVEFSTASAQETPAPPPAEDVPVSKVDFSTAPAAESVHADSPSRASPNLTEGTSAAVLVAASTETAAVPNIGSTAPRASEDGLILKIPVGPNSEQLRNFVGREVLLRGMVGAEGEGFKIRINEFADPSDVLPVKTAPGAEERKSDADSTLKPVLRRNLKTGTFQPWIGAGGAALADDVYNWAASLAVRSPGGKYEIRYSYWQYSRTGREYSLIGGREQFFSDIRMNVSASQLVFSRRLQPDRIYIPAVLDIKFRGVLRAGAGLGFYRLAQSHYTRHHLNNSASSTPLAILENKRTIYLPVPVFEAGYAYPVNEVLEVELRASYAQESARGIGGMHYGKWAGILTCGYRLF